MKRIIVQCVLAFAMVVTCIVQGCGVADSDLVPRECEVPGELPELPSTSGAGSGTYGAQGEQDPCAVATSDPRKVECDLLKNGEKVARQRSFGEHTTIEAGEADCDNLAGKDINSGYDCTNCSWATEIDPATPATQWECNASAVCVWAGKKDTFYRYGKGDSAADAAAEAKKSVRNACAKFSGSKIVETTWSVSCEPL